MLELVQGLSADDLVLCLISGGGSALLPCRSRASAWKTSRPSTAPCSNPAPAISEMNCVRRHLSAIKGGRLAAACHPARVVNLLISDVPGDNPMDIASGPTVADPTTCADALAIVRRYGSSCRRRPRTCWRAAAASRSNRATAPGRSRDRLIATPQMALEAAAGWPPAGVAVHILGDALEGEARDVGKVMAGIALQVAARPALRAPCVLLSGGESTVTVRGNGRGGRNVEFLLALAWR
jgi:glycerate 2-kinase